MEPSRPHVSIVARVRPSLAREETAIEAGAKAEHLAATAEEIVERLCVSQSSTSSVEVELDNGKVEKFTGLGAYNCDTIIESIRGGNTSYCVMAYGQTGSGKTYTCTELLPRVSEMLLGYVEKGYEVQLNAFELYLGSIKDLLREEACSVRQDAKGRTHVDAKKVVVGTQEDAESLINKAFANRASSATKSNEQSSRSHAFVRFTLRKGKEGEEGEEEREVTIVDLAGNERYEETFHHDAARLAEMKAINASLGCLKDCLRAVLKNKEGGYVPFRRSKLTTILSSLWSTVNRASAVLIAHLAPTRSSLKHSMNTLRLVSLIVERDSLADRERKSFSGPLAWSADQMVCYVRTLEDGKFEALADSFHITGKLFSVEWKGHVERRVVAAGGTEKDAEAIYDAFHEKLRQHKEKEKDMGKKAGPRSAIAAMRAKAKASFAQSFSEDDVVVVERRKET